MPQHTEEYSSLTRQIDELAVKICALCENLKQAPREEDKETYREELEHLAPELLEYCEKRRQLGES